MKLARHVIGIGLAAALCACGKKAEQGAPAPQNPGSGSGSAAAPVPPPPPPDPPESPKATMTIGEYFDTPESVLYDTTRDNYLVSNIKGGPADHDDNGYFVVLQPDGSAFKWIDGSADDIKLDAPKGTAIVGDTLYVADISVVRRFDRQKGVQQADIPIEGATFLNDVVADGAGGIFVSDTGMDAKFQPTGTDAIYHVGKDGKVTTLIKDKALGKPNGLAMGDNGAVWVVTFGTGEIYAVDANGKQGPAEKLPHGMLDGVVVLDGGDLLVSSWEGKAIYRGKPGGTWTPVVTGIESPADITYDPKRKQILVPVFNKGEVKAFALP